MIHASCEDNEIKYRKFGHTELHTAVWYGILEFNVPLDTV